MINQAISWCVFFNRECKTLHLCLNECHSMRNLEPGVDTINHPPHYTSNPSGVECITITRHMNFNRGNAMKYLWRAGEKENQEIADLEKAKWYINDEIERLRTKSTSKVQSPGKAMSTDLPTGSREAKGKEK